jgi:AcrR family transcriptional regulator
VRLSADRRRRQLLDVARDVFARRGFHATSMDDVAAAAGVTKPVLYQHFPSKRALFVELLDDVGHRLIHALGAATSAAHTGRERV